ncbi:ribonuclease domain-containing protein [Nocardia australiensis]|uniref:ribonuclease domain-containing protein n=1 Tax=Nocardia australiensis TaxID=2887191 RepID=UPI001D1497BA|nr:ribonuclease domain-containing protein [Nocardia australiensis]
MKLSPKTMRVLAALGALIVALVVAGFELGGGDTDPAASSSTSTVRATAAVAAPGATKASDPTRVAGVPDRAYTTLTEIDAGRWPGSANAPGTKGGDRWMNRGGDLPAKDAAGKAVTYQEWDVNPKQPSHSRDAERIVTGSDDSVWYTGDHYKTFTRMR